MPEGCNGWPAAVYHAEIERRLRERLLPLGEANWFGGEAGHLIARATSIWVVDPNDGTWAFLKRLRGSSVSVALLGDGRPVLGVVYAPTAPDDLGDLFAWAEGRSLTRNGVQVRSPQIRAASIGAPSWR